MILHVLINFLFNTFLMSRRMLEIKVEWISEDPPMSILTELMIFLIRHLNVLPKEIKYYVFIRSVLIVIGIVEMWWRITWFVMDLFMDTPNEFFMKKDFPQEIRHIQPMIKLSTDMIILTNYFKTLLGMLQMIWDMKE